MSEARIDRLEAGLARVEQVIIRIEGSAGCDSAAPCDRCRTRRQTELGLQLGYQGDNDRRLYRRTRYGCDGRRCID